MKSRSPNVTKPGRWVIGLVSLALSSAASGCVLGNDSDPPVLSTDLFWDRSPQSGKFSNGTCESAGVVWMDWQLKDEDDRVVVTSEDGGQECEDGFDFVDVGPGNYKLTVMGYDDAEQQLWNGSCDGLVLERFDVLYPCRVERSDP
jgi:hypothetical protein